MSELCPYTFLEEAITGSGFEYNPNIVAIANDYPNGKALFQTLNGTSNEYLGQTDWSDEKKEQYNLLFYSKQLSYYEQWITQNPELADILHQDRIVPLKKTIAALDGVEPICEQEVYGDFAEVVCRMLTPCPVQLNGGAK